jgi:hypothetical protein
MKGLTMLNNIPIRFFTDCFDSDGEIDSCEITESQFKEIQLNRYGNDLPVTYERHTVHQNGVSQICLTIHPVDLPQFDELEGV